MHAEIEPRADNANKLNFKIALKIQHRLKKMLCVLAGILYDSNSFQFDIRVIINGGQILVEVAGSVHVACRLVNRVILFVTIRSLVCMV